MSGRRQGTGRRLVDDGGLVAAAVVAPLRVSSEGITGLMLGSFVAGVLITAGIMLGM